MVFRFTVDEILMDKDQKGCLTMNTTAELVNIKNRTSIFVKESMEEYEKFCQDWINEGLDAGEISRSFSFLAEARHLYTSLSGLKIMA
jgi:TetR/AcrR family transcriptional repressor of nem operon